MQKFTVRAAHRPTPTGSLWRDKREIEAEDFDAAFMQVGRRYATGVYFKIDGGSIMRVNMKGCQPYAAMEPIPEEIIKALNEL